MNRRRYARTAAYTLIELLVTLAIITILAALLLPALIKGKARARQIKCLSQLKQAGLAFHMFAHEHNGFFPMSVSTNAGGTLEYVQTGYALGEFYFSFRHFQVLGNELQTPGILICPADTRSAAASFHALKNENVSYFVATASEYRSPNAVLAGDRNITNAYGTTHSLMGVGFTMPVGWTHELHKFRGNLLFADGRVELANHSGLSRVMGPGAGTENLVMPPVAGSGPGSMNRGRSGKHPAARPSPLEEAIKKAAAASEPLNSSSTGSRMLSQTLESPGVAPAAYSPPTPVVLETNSPAPARSTAQPTTDSLFPLWIVALAQELAQLRRWTVFFLILLMLLALALAILRFLFWRRSRT